MSKVFKWILKEARSIFPAVLYFFCAINLFNLTFGRLLQEAGSRLMTFPRIVISSLIIGKIMLVAEALPFLNKFSGKPLIYGTLWKTFIYSFFGFLFLVVERLIPFFFKYNDKAEAWQHMLKDTLWSRLCIAQVWLVVLFLIFVVLKEFINTIGKDKVRQIFFGR